MKEPASIALHLFDNGTTRESVLIYRPGNTGLADAIEATEAASLEPQYAPELARFRSNAPRDATLWQNWIYTLSIRATGRTKAGTKVVVYAHVPNHYSNHEHLRAAVEGKTLRNGAGPLPQEEFQRLVDLDGQTDNQDVRRVWVVGYDTLKQSRNGIIALEHATKHPQIVPFLGSADNAQQYLAAHAATHAQELDTCIGVWHSDDFAESSPRARLLLFGDGDNDGLYGSGVLHSEGRFLGVAPATQPRTTRREW